MKRISGFIFCFVLVLALSACGGSGNSGTTSNNSANAGNEGTTSGPVVLTLGSGHNGGVAGGGTSIYTFTTNTADEYSVKFTNVAPAGGMLTILITSMGGSVVANCTTALAVCNAPFLSASTSYLVAVSSTAATTYTITADHFQSGSEGSWSNPIPLTLNTPHYGMVGNSARSYYSFTPTTAGPYSIALTDLNPNTSIPERIIFNPDNPAQSIPGGVLLSDTDSCTLAANTTYIIEIYGMLSEQTYTITVTP